MKMYFDFIKERKGLEGFSDEKGFYTYKIDNDEFFLENMYIAPEFRGSGCVEFYINNILEIAKSLNCGIITANIYIADSGASRTLRAALRLGFKIVATHNGVLMIKKEV